MIRRLLAYAATALAGIGTGAVLALLVVGWVAIVEGAKADANELAARQAYAELGKCIRKLPPEPFWQPTR